LKDSFRRNLLLRGGGKDRFLLDIGADRRSPRRAGTDKQST
jgi:hypothetical protein